MRFHNDTFNSLYHRVSSYVSFGGHGLRRDLPVHKAPQGLLGGPSGATSTGRRRVWGISHAPTPSSHSYTDGGSIAATVSWHPYATCCAGGCRHLHTCGSGGRYHSRRRDKPEHEHFPKNRSSDGQFDWGNLGMIGNVWSTLIRVSPQDRVTIEGDLAESWTTSPDGMEYSFKIRSDVVDPRG